MIVDAGSKSVADPANATIVGHPHEFFRFDEEHGIFAAPHGSSLHVGDSVALVPGYLPTTVNMYDAFFVVSGEHVVDVWQWYRAALAIMDSRRSSSAPLGSPVRRLERPEQDGLEVRIGQDRGIALHAA